MSQRPGQEQEQLVHQLQRQPQVGLCMEEVVGGL